MAPGPDGIGFDGTPFVSFLVSQPKNHDATAQNRARQRPGDSGILHRVTRQERLFRKIMPATNPTSRSLDFTRTRSTRNLTHPAL